MGVKHSSMDCTDSIPRHVLPCPQFGYPSWETQRQDRRTLLHQSSPFRGVLLPSQCDLHLKGINQLYCF